MCIITLFMGLCSRDDDDDGTGGGVSSRWKEKNPNKLLLALLLFGIIMV